MHLGSFLMESTRPETQRNGGGGDDDGDGESDGDGDEGWDRQMKGK